MYIVCIYRHRPIEYLYYFSLMWSRVRSRDCDLKGCWDIGSLSYVVHLVKTNKPAAFSLSLTLPPKSQRQFEPICSSAYRQNLWVERANKLRCAPITRPAAIHQSEIKFDRSIDQSGAATTPEWIYEANQQRHTWYNYWRIGFAECESKG